MVTIRQVRMDAHYFFTETLGTFPGLWILELQFWTAGKKWRTPQKCHVLISFSIMLLCQML